MGTEHLNNHHELTVQGSIRKSRLQRNQYTISLMNEGLRNGLLTTREAAHIQKGFMGILQELILKYTRGESTSVTTETAESLLSSIMYAADACLLDCGEPEQAMLSLQPKEVRQIYETGVQKVSQCFEETKQLYQEITTHKLDVPVDAYNLTIDESLPVFFRKYGILFNAHNSMASIDYPLASDDMRLLGVFYIRQYLERLKLENEFCAMFNQRELLNLLACYGRECRFNYRIELFNIFELVLNNAIFSVLSDGKPDSIRISGNQFKRLEEQLISLTDRQIRAAVSGAMERLQQELMIHPQLKEYMDGCRETIVQRVVNTTNYGGLQAVIIVEKDTKTEPGVMYFSAEERITDVELRRLLQEILATGEKTDKVGLILSSIHAFHDFLDMLEAECLYGDEYDALFDALGDTELAVLGKIIFYEELRDESQDLPSILLLDNEYPMDWQMYFVRYLQSMSRERLVVLGKVIDHLDYEQMTFY